MPYEQRDNSGSAFRNDRKREGKQDADWTGSLTVGGKAYWLNIWEKDGARGAYFSIAVREKTAAPQSDHEPPARKMATPPAKPTNQRPPQDDVPF